MSSRLWNIVLRPILTPIYLSLTLALYLPSYPPRLLQLHPNQWFPCRETYSHGAQTLYLANPNLRLSFVSRPATHNSSLRIPNHVMNRHRSLMLCMFPWEKTRWEIACSLSAYLRPVSFARSLMIPLYSTISGSSYVSPDGSLSGKLEARLAKPEADCIIC